MIICPECGSSEVKSICPDKTETTEEHGEIEVFADVNICNDCGLFF